MVDTTDKDKDEEEDEDLFYSTKNDGPNREDMAAQYLPEQDDWTAKTVLDLNDPGRVAVLRNMDQLFPEIAHLQPVLDDFLENFMKGRTSIGGSSRNEYQRILESMFGGHPGDDKGSMLVDALASDLDDDD